MQKLLTYCSYVLPHHSLSRLAGAISNCRWRWLKNRLINSFVKHYPVNLSEATISHREDYVNFNQFFTRALRPEARPIDADKRTIICPADGTLCQLGTIEHGQLLQAKGISYSLTGLLTTSALASEFADGSFATIYLAPHNYHRVHMPITGQLQHMITVPGRLFSVNATSNQHIPNLFSRNERVICIFKTDQGPMAVVLVGAMLVASIVTRWAGVMTPTTQRGIQQTTYHEQPIVINKGQELGYFQFGSTVIMLFAANRVNWLANVAVPSTVHMGQAVGTQQSQ